MFNEVNTVDVDDPTRYWSVSSYWQHSQQTQPFEARNKLLIQPRSLGFVVTSDVELKDVSDDSVLTFVETQSTLKLSYRNPEAVKIYLAGHPEIEKFIEAARPTLSQFFGSPLEIILELIIYPDEVASKELVGWIQKTGDVEECLAQFEQFEDEWFLDHMDQVGDKFNFNIEIK